MTRVTFGISASCFAANMAIKKNAQEFSSTYPLAAKVAQENFYVDDGLSGADGIDQAMHLRMELQQLFNQGGFTLRKWNSSEKSVLDAIPPELRESDEVLAISDAGSLEWQRHWVFHGTQDSMPFSCLLQTASQLKMSQNDFCCQTYLKSMMLWAGLLLLLQR